MRDKRGRGVIQVIHMEAEAWRLVRRHAMTASPGISETARPWSSSKAKSATRGHLRPTRVHP